MSKFRIIDFDLTTREQFMRCSRFDLFNLCVHYLGEGYYSDFMKLSKKKNVTKAEYISLLQAQQLKNFLDKVRFIYERYRES